MTPIDELKIIKVLKEHSTASKYRINPDNSVDVFESIRLYISSEFLELFPEIIEKKKFGFDITLPFKFRNIFGDFYIDRSKSEEHEFSFCFSSLKNFPDYCDGSVNICSDSIYVKSLNGIGTVSWNLYAKLCGSKYNGMWRKDDLLNDCPNLKIGKFFNYNGLSMDSIPFFDYIEEKPNESN